MAVTLTFLMVQYGRDNEWKLFNEIDIRIDIFFSPCIPN